MAKKEKTVSSVFFNGILNENPTLRLVLGICPTLASTTSASNAVHGPCGNVRSGRLKRGHIPFEEHNTRQDPHSRVRRDNMHVRYAG